MLTSGSMLHRLILLLATLPQLILCQSYNHQWAAEIPGGVEHAREVADSTGCQLENEIIPGESIYLLSCHHVRRRSTEQDFKVHSDINNHEHVVWAEQQEVKNRRRRQGFWPGGFGGGGWGQPQSPRRQPEQTYSDYPYENPLSLNDERWGLMWYLNRGNGIDMNVQEAWESGITGKGIVVTILDDGVEKNNPDLVENYDPMASYDVNENDNDPTPRYDLVDSNRHGTRCAGEVSASANNSVCGVGVAYNSRIGGVRMLDGDVTDAVEARSISLNNQHIDIYSASWGPDDDGKTVDGPGNLAKRAFINGIQNGRNGKGSIFVWASGNGGRDHDNCNCDGYTNSIWTLSVSSATENGLIPWYSEACSSTMATTYSSGSSGERKVISTDLHNLCTSTHTGTSASAPMAAGVIALVLQANPSLTWRDIQHITVRNCHVANLRATDWRINAMGRNFSHSFGYGIMDASAMVRMAKTWTVVPEQKSSAVNADIGRVSIPPSSSRSAKMQVQDSGDVNFLEHVQAHITLTALRRGDVQMYLTSPGGTKSQLLARRPHDTSRAGFQDWPFLTVFCWGENPKGSWLLEIQNDGRSMVELLAWSLTFHGTLSDPSPPPTLPAPTPSLPSPSNPKPKEPVPAPAIKPESTTRSNHRSRPLATESSAPPTHQASPLVPEAFNNPLPEAVVPTSIENCLVQSTAAWCSACKPGYLVLSGNCVTKCPEEGYYQFTVQGESDLSSHCLQCYYTCKTCSGPTNSKCESCYGDAELDKSQPGEKYCHEKNLVLQVFSSTRWYYLLTFGFLINIILIIVLLVYIYRRKSNKGGVYRPGTVYDRVLQVPTAGKGYKPVNPAEPSGGLKPFHDDMSSDEDAGEGFMTPYSDNPKGKPYRDEENR
ncbi:furin-like protease kpc-1 isoform X3 [Eurytemora carolleeae]|uniref:furin-like protease kpc-1 isoform X3 n=1 Tax=Eurytemora carolleeae TaxID=1294199 RepID=UPI000C7647D3|nr:furin-like protease kpc-1 isoform X3 [Eurytemora carolleeae]|eukprot:XP_023337148.1 furin-like protease kpc-1 isoform X3 [Eurytemora affinis]